MSRLSGPKASVTDSLTLDISPSDSNRSDFGSDGLGPALDDTPTPISRSEATRLNPVLQPKTNLFTTGLGQPSESEATIPPTGFPHTVPSGILPKTPVGSGHCTYILRNRDRARYTPYVRMTGISTSPITSDGVESTGTDAISRRYSRLKREGACYLRLRNDSDGSPVVVNGTPCLLS
jgi:hypothetical protein